MSREGLGYFELLVLLALVRLGDEAYGVPIANLVSQATGRDVASGSIYSCLERLRRKNLVDSRTGEPLPERGGRARRYYAITAEGSREIRAAQESLRALWHPFREDAYSHAHI